MPKAFRMKCVEGIRLSSDYTLSFLIGGRWVYVKTFNTQKEAEEAYHDAYNKLSQEEGRYLHCVEEK